MSHFKKLFLFAFLIPLYANAVSYGVLERLFDQEFESPFGYSLAVSLVPAEKENAQVLLCFHGFGGNNQIAELVSQAIQRMNHVISFNFPDANLNPQTFNPLLSSFGTPQELLPALFLMKKLVVEGGVKQLNLYGFSAGGGAIVNVVSILNSPNHQILESLHIEDKDRKALLKAVEHGIIVLDSPLKSIEEISDFRGYALEMEIYKQRYRENEMVPIESLKKWKNLRLQVLVYFEQPDEILSNRDDALFAERLKEANANGTTCVITGHEGGHNGPHPSLWNAYRQLLRTGKCPPARILLLEQKKA